MNLAPNNNKKIQKKFCYPVLFMQRLILRTVWGLKIKNLNHSQTHHLNAITLTLSISTSLHLSGICFLTSHQHIQLNIIIQVKVQ